MSPDQSPIQSILYLLDVRTLSRLTDLNDLEVPDRRSRAYMETALNAHYKQIDDLVCDLKMNELQDLCNELEIESSGTKIALAQTVVGAVQPGYPPTKKLADEDKSTHHPQPDPNKRTAAANTIKQTDVGEYAPLKPLSWYLLDAPGHAMIWLEYMFHKRGNVIGSGRRYRSPGLRKF